MLLTLTKHFFKEPTEKKETFWIHNFMNSHSFAYFHSQQALLETVWALAPAVILIIIAIPSFALLYSLEELVTPQATYRVIGHQWYWSYQYRFFSQATYLSYDSYMQKHPDIKDLAYILGTEGQAACERKIDEALDMPRLITCDNTLLMPINRTLRLLITSTDVLHSWAVPAFGIKLDACPGRFNMTSLFITHLGTYYGQCSEICGVNHGFMPIHIQTFRI